MTYDTEESNSDAFSNAVREYFVALRWHERAMQNVEKAREEVARSSASKQQALHSLKDYVSNADEVARVCSCLLDPL
jgi:hypothetical protein